MFLAFKLGDIIKVPFGWFLWFLYDFTNNYGLALIIFAIVVKLVLLPATAKGKKSSMKMSRLTPRIEAIKAKFPDDQQKQSAEIQALYKSEGVSMGGGCLWSLLPLLVLIPLYAVVRQPISYMLREAAYSTGLIETMREWIPNAFSKNTAYDEMIVAQNMPYLREAVMERFPDLKASSYDGINFSFLGINLGEVPSWKFWAWEFTSVKGPWQFIGGALMPILSAGGQLVSMLLSQKMNNSLVTNDKGVQDDETAKKGQGQQQMKMMMWVSPIISLWIGFSMPAALSLYWFAQGIVTTVSDVLMTKHYRKIYDAEDAERLKKHMEEEAIEAEKERVRAERRAANPEGITANTSKKKLQQAKQEAREKERAAAAREYAASKGEVVEAPKEEKKALSGIADRPFCKGRAYDPNRYQNTEEK